MKLKFKAGIYIPLFHGRYRSLGKDVVDDFAVDIC